MTHEHRLLDLLSAKVLVHAVAAAAAAAVVVVVVLVVVVVVVARMGRTMCTLRSCGRNDTKESSRV